MSLLPRGGQYTHLRRPSSCPHTCEVHGTYTLSPRESPLQLASADPSAEEKLPSCLLLLRAWPAARLTQTGQWLVRQSLRLDPEGKWARAQRCPSGRSIQGCPQAKEPFSLLRPRPHPCAYTSLLPDPQRQLPLSAWFLPQSVFLRTRPTLTPGRVTHETPRLTYMIAIRPMSSC